MEVFVEHSPLEMIGLRTREVYPLDSVRKVIKNTTAGHYVVVSSGELEFLQSLEHLPIPVLQADFSQGEYYFSPQKMGFDELFTFSRLSAAWKLNALGHWVKVLAGEPRTGHHVWKEGQLVPTGIAVCSEVRTQFLPYASSPATNWGSPNSNTNAVANGFTRVTSDGTASFPRAEKSPNITAPGTYTVQTEVREGSSGEVFLRVSGVDIGPQLGTSSVYKFDFSDQSFVKVGGADATKTYVEEREPGVFRIAFSFTATSVAWVNIYPAWGDDTPGLSAEFRHPMLSEGGVPGDFIPNDTGAPVSTASESLQPDPVKLVRAVGVFGPELPLTRSSAAAWDAETKIATYPGGSYGHIHAALADGEIAFVSGNLATGDTIQVKQNDGGVYPTIHTGADGYFEGLVVGANGVGLRIYLNDQGSYPAATVSNLQVRKVTMPEALTLVMKGTKSYADDDLARQVTFFDWAQNENNSLSALMYTTTGTGGLRVVSRNDGSFDQTYSDDSVFVPGVDVPFSIALVLTATEIEGFHNGVSTGKTIHGGMANLLSAPLQLFPVGTATIEQFAIYVGNPGSAALQEATS